MKRVLVTGATGNIGSEVIHYLKESSSDNEIIAAVRNIQHAEQRFKKHPNLQFRQFDFEKPESFVTTFKDIDILFLLRPPHISKIDKFFRPLLAYAWKSGIKNVVFLSVQGAEKSKVIPHNKIEHLIQELGFNYIFVRPSYFMQNLTTTLLPEIVNEKSITLPSGKAIFNWIDVKNIGEATARLILDFEKHQHQALEITGTENKSFPDVVRLINETIDETITFKNINPIHFYFKKRKEGIAGGFAMVMTILHFLPRFQSDPKISGNYSLLTGKSPTTLKEFIKREKVIFALKQATN